MACASNSSSVEIIDSSWCVRLRLSLQLVSSRNQLRVRRGMVESHLALPPNATILLAYMCQSPPGTRFAREDVERPFSERAYNVDTLRTVTNRALTAINELGQQELGRDIVHRQAVLDDKRRQEYAVVVRISVV